LPDGFFSNQKYQFWYIWEGLGTENAGIFNGHLEYFTAIASLYGLVVYFLVMMHISPVLVCCAKKSLATLLDS
jgi:hypothetical protein